MKEVVVTHREQGKKLSRNMFKEIVFMAMIRNYETNCAFMADRRRICDMGVEIYYAQLDTRARKGI